MTDATTCTEVIARLLEYLDGEMEPEQSDRIGRHLEECRACYTRHEFERALREKVASLGEDKATPSLRRRLKELIDRF